MKKKIGILLVNLGTPDSPKTADVRKYLTEFLTDGRVIDFPWLPRQLLVRGIISPFRAGSSAKTYKEIWDETTGSPLLHYSVQFADQLRELFVAQNDEQTEYIVELAMRYQSPSLDSALSNLQQAQVDRIVVFPLFPQYASATTGSIHQKVMEIVGSWWEIPEISFVNSYPTYEPMIEVFADNGRSYDPGSYDHILFSFHGLPQRQLRKASLNNYCLNQPGNCCETLCQENKMCYSAQCYATARAIAAELDLSEADYTVCFQSRLGRDPWAQPYTSDVLEHLAEAGKKRVLVFCPAFVADCLETIFEIGEEYQEEFEEAGGEKVQLVESLNDNDKWVRSVFDLLMPYCGVEAVQRLG